VIPFLRHQVGLRRARPELDAAYRRVMESAGSCSARRFEAFEAEYAAFCGTRHCVASATGSKRWSLSCGAWNIGAGDEGHRALQHYIATWLAVTAVDATVVPVERRRGAQHRSDRLMCAITPRPKAIMPVHLYGEPADMVAIMAWRRKHV